jgi:hypothetical protein
VIRIGHSEIAAARQDFAAWWRQKQQPGPTGRRLGYAQLVKLGIYKYHALQSNRAGSLAHFDHLAAARLTNAQRITQARLQLQAYIDWIERAGVIVADHRVRLNLPLGADVALGGEVSRVDIVPSGYRVVLLVARTPVHWRDELRMPLIQLAIADRYHRDAEDVRVALQLLDGTALEEASFGKDARNAALRAAIAVAKQVGRVVARRRRRP